jgi:hypothetical protein
VEPPPLARRAGWFMLAFGFETLAFRQKTKLSCLSTVFQGQPDIGSNEMSGINNITCDMNMDD